MLNRNFSPYDYFALFTCAILTLRAPLTAWVIPFDGACRISLCLLIMSVALEFKEIKKILRIYPISIYLVLAIYMFFNGYFNGAYTDKTSSNLLIFNYLFFDALSAPLFMMLSIRLLLVNFDATLKLETISLLLYGLISIIFSTVSDENRLAGEGGANGNIVALNMVVCIVCSLILYFRRQIGYISVAIICIFSFGLILLTACRMAVSMCAIIAVVISSYYFKRGTSLQKTYCIFVLLFIFISAFVIMQYTTVGERFASTTEQSEGKVYETGTLWDKFGDRGAQYYFSWPEFLKRPVTGIGFRMWGRIGISIYRAHSEYIAMYVENGLIALTLWIMFIVAIFKKSFLGLKSNVRIIRKTSLCVIAFLCSLLFAFFVLWTYDSCPVFFVYSIAATLPIWDKRYKRLMA